MDLGLLGNYTGKMEHLKIMIRKAVLAAAIGILPSMPSAMGTLNPYFTAKDILPAALGNAAGIGGIDLLPNGDGVICVWGGSQGYRNNAPRNAGEVWIIPELASGTPGTPVKVATGLREPLGVKVVGQDFYVMEKPQITKFTGSGSNWTKSPLWKLDSMWFNDNNWHHFAWGLVYKDSAFWLTTGMEYDPKPNDPVQRGGLLKVALNGSGYTQYSRGMRNTSGPALGPEDEMFMTDNQGHWKPIDYLYHVPTPKTAPAKKGRFYGYRTTVNNDCGLTPDNLAQDNCPQDPVYQPAVWLPYGGFSNSPTRPILLKAGPYAGQMIFGDVFHGDILRTFVEKVNGEWQGAAFTFMTQKKGGGGLQFGVYQFLYTPSGSLLAAGIGGGACGLEGSGNWNWQGTCRGLALLTPTTDIPFDILAIRSVNDGFDIEFSQPAAAAAGQASNWSLSRTQIVPTFEYGVNAKGTETNASVPISGASLSEDGKHVRLMVTTLTTRRYYTITASSAVKSASGSDLWTNVGYYTLNSVSPSSTAARPSIVSFAGKIHASLHPGRIAFDVPFQKDWKLEVRRWDGARVSQASGSGPSRFESASLPRGIYLVAGRADGGAFSEKVQVQ